MSSSEQDQRDWAVWTKLGHEHEDLEITSRRGRSETRNTAVEKVTSAQKILNKIWLCEHKILTVQVRNPSGIALRQRNESTARTIQPPARTI